MPLFGKARTKREARVQRRAIGATARALNSRRVEKDRQTNRAAWWVLFWIIGSILYLAWWILFGVFYRVPRWFLRGSVRRPKGRSTADLAKMRIDNHTRHARDLPVEFVHRLEAAKVVNQS